MKNENLNPNNPDPPDPAEDLQIVKTAIQQTSRTLKPDTHIMITWGIICICVYSSIHFLIKNQQAKWLPAVFLIPSIIGLVYVFASLLKISRREKSEGFIPLLRQQITWVWIIIMVIHGFTWSIMGLVSKNYCAGDPGFLFAMLFSIALCITGILHEKQWLYGGIFIFIAAFSTYFTKDYGYLVLGAAVAAGLIIPAIIVQKNYRKQELENDQG